MDDITSPRPFENDEEVSTLSTLLKSQLNLHNVSCPFQAEADATDVTNYILELVEDNETVGQIINEVRDLGFTEICTEETLEALRVKLAEFLVGMEGRGWKNKWEAAVRKDTEQQQQNNSSVSAATITPPMTPPKKEVKEKEISSSSPTSSPSRPTLQKQNTQDSDYYKEIQARLSAKNTTVETIGSQSAGRKLTYAEEIQARERARGEAIVKNSAKAQSGARRASLHSYTSSASAEGENGEGGGNNNHEERGHSPDSVNADLSGRSVDVDVNQDLDQMRREELMIVMKDRSLSREEKAMKMKEIREKYA